MARAPSKAASGGGVGPQDAAASGGNDGSDFQYRMLVDDRYKKAADARKTLQRLASLQGTYVMLRGLMSAALLAHAGMKRRALEEDASAAEWWRTYVTSTARLHTLSLADAVPLYMLIVTAFGALIGTLAVQGTKARAVRWHGWLGGVAAVMALWPFVTGRALHAIQSEYADAVDSGESTWLVVTVLESAQDVLGIIGNVAVFFVARTLASAMQLPKKQR